MNKHKTTKQYIEEAKALWGDVFDYSLVDYKGCDDKIDIGCPKHGVFSIRASSHLRGYGCKKCSLEKRRDHVRGIGVNDVPLSTCGEGRLKNPVFAIWSSILTRVTSAKPIHDPYFDTTICLEWLRFSKFKEWVDNPMSGYMEGYAIDKDIISPGSKIYSPETCCFVPTRINLLFVKHNTPSDKPTGIIMKGGSFYTHVKINNRVLSSTFYNMHDAMDDYVKKKSEIIRSVAEEYYQKGLIIKRVYDAMIRFPVREYLTNYNQIAV